MKKVYALLTKRCNLTCPYCDVKNMEDDFNHDKFIGELKNFEGMITLFGGEPTLYRDRLKEIVYDDVIGQKPLFMTTNLMVVDDELMEILKKINGSATSWNPSRFRNNEYEIWKDNLDKVNGQVVLRVLVTMTFDVLKMKPAEVADIISTWNRNTVGDVMFENLIDDSVDEEYFRRVDDWLCEIFDMRDKLPPLISNMGDANFKCMDCSEIFTLNPNGTIVPGCPHKQPIQQMYVPDECYGCDHSMICRPCRLQKYCSVPKKLHQKLLAEIKGS